jgi:hypothetical protein
MRGADLTPLPIRGVAAAPPDAATATSASASPWRRRAAVLVALALPVTMLAPWYTLQVSARGVSERHGFAQPLTGWEALSDAGIACLLVAAGVCALILVRALGTVSGLGAERRRAARVRVDGALIAGAGLACVVALLWTAVAPPGTATGRVAVSIHTGLRWGILLALALALLLTALGVQIAAAAGRRLRDLRGQGASAARAPGQPAPGRSTNENSALSRPTIRIPSAISQRRRVM